MRKISVLFRRHPVIVNTALFCLVVLAAFMIRSWHYNNSVEIVRQLILDAPAPDPEPSVLRRFFPLHHNSFSPFTVESAMMYHYAEKVATGEGVPASDPRLAGMEDLPPYAQMNMALEWFLGWGWKIKNAVSPDPAPDPWELRFQDHPAMAQWMSTQLRFWASLASGFLFLWLIAMRCPRILALFGGLLHAVSLAAVARSTGQDFVRGEFCIPLIVLCFALVATMAVRPKLYKGALLFCAAFLAFVSWDLCQMIFGCWAFYEIFRFLLGYKISKGRAAAWICIAAAVLLNALFVPFNRAYSLIQAPILWVALPSLAASFAWGMIPKLRTRTPAMRLLPALVLPILLFCFWNVAGNTPEYASNYSHFSEAMKAKIQYWNMKPSDPDRLSYDARIMWTPSMHSCTWDIAVGFFPSLPFGRKYDFHVFRFLFGYLPLTLGFYFALLFATTLFQIPRREFVRRLPVTLMPHLFTIGYFIGFIYIVRYHEFLILFLAAALPLLVGDWLRAFRRRPALVVPSEAFTRLYDKKYFMGTVRVLLGIICALLLFHESVSSLAGLREYSGDVPMGDAARLIEWLRMEPSAVRGKVFAANLTTGPMLLAYADAGITMNPQFGMKRIRDATEQYYKALFTPGEEALLEYCEKYHVDYLLYNNGMIFDMGPYSVRYIAGAKKVEPHSPANLMYYRPDALRWFYRIEPPYELGRLSKTFRLFKVIKPEDKRAAARLTLQAMDAMDQKRMEDAEKLVSEALTIDPASDAGRNLYLELHHDFPEITLSGPARK